MSNSMSIYSTKYTPQSMEISKGTFEENYMEVPDYIKIKFMQKDKKIFEYGNKLNDANIMINKLKGNIDQKERELIQLKSMIKDLTKEVNSKSEMIMSSHEKIEEIQMDEKRENAALKIKNKTLTLQVNELIEKNEELQAKLNEMFSSNQNYQVAINTKDRELTEGKVTLARYEEMIKSLTNENKKIAVLNHTLTETSNTLEKMSLNDNENKTIIDKLTKENEALNNYLQSFTNEYEITRENCENHITGLQAELIDLSNQLKQKTNEALQSKQKSKIYMKDHDNLILFTGNQLDNIILNLSNDSTCFSNSLENTLQSSSSSVSNEWLNNSKYEKIKSNIIKIQKKIVENNAKVYGQSKVHQNHMDKVLFENKELMNKIEEQRKVEAFDKNAIEEFKKQIVKFEQFNDNYNKLKESYVKLFSDYEELTAKNEKVATDTNNFLQSALEKLMKNNPFNQDSSLSISDKVLKGIDTIIEKHIKLKSEFEIKEKDLNDQKVINDDLTKTYQQKEKTIKDDNEKNITKKNEDIQKLKKVSSKQILELTKLLNDSKEMLLKYQKDYDALLEENNKLVYQLQVKEKEEEDDEN